MTTTLKTTALLLATLLTTLLATEAQAQTATSRRGSTTITSQINGNGSVTVSTYRHGALIRRRYRPSRVWNPRLQTPCGPAPVTRHPRTKKPLPFPKPPKIDTRKVTRIKAWSKNGRVHVVSYNANGQVVSRRSFIE